MPGTKRGGGKGGGLSAGEKMLLAGRECEAGEKEGGFLAEPQWVSDGAEGLGHFHGEKGGRGGFGLKFSEGGGGGVDF